MEVPLHRGVAMGLFDRFIKKSVLVAPVPPVQDIPSDIPPIHADEQEQASELGQIAQNEENLLSGSDRGQEEYGTDAISLPERPIQDQSGQEEERITRPIPATMFISVSDYRTILTGVNTIRSRLSEVDHVLSRLSTIRTEEEHHLSRWRQELEDVERKLNAVDHIIAKAG